MKVISTLTILDRVLEWIKRWPCKVVFEVAASLIKYFSYPNITVILVYHKHSHWGNNLGSRSIEGASLLRSRISCLILKFAWISGNIQLKQPFPRAEKFCATTIIRLCIKEKKNTRNANHEKDRLPLEFLIAFIKQFQIISIRKFVSVVSSWYSHRTVLLLTCLLFIPSYF